MNILVECKHDIDNEEYMLCMVDTDKMDLNNPHHVIINKAIELALFEGNNRYVKISESDFHIFQKIMDSSGSFISFQFEGKTIDKFISMFWS